MLRAATERLLRSSGFEIRRVDSAARALRSQEPSSLFGEATIIGDLLGTVQAPAWCVDIAAGDGREMSNSFGLYRDDWDGLAVEVDGARFAALATLYATRPKVRLWRGRVTPGNVVALLAAAQTPAEFAFLSLDIDGFDYFVLESILSQYRPALICAEINEKIPPPIRFTVLYSDDYEWDLSLFYGQSIAQLDVLRARHDYALVQLEYNNAFLMPAEIAPRSMTAEDAYRDGYLRRGDRLEKMPWNAPYEELLTMSPTDGVTRIEELLAANRGLYELSLSEDASTGG
jgi:hypothetical protein